MIKLLWFLLKIFDNNWGYTTSLQERFEIGCKCKISKFKTKETEFDYDEIVTIIEKGRHDYLVENVKGIKSIVYQFELVK